LAFKRDLNLDRTDLDCVAVTQFGFRDLAPVYESSIRAPQVGDRASRRLHVDGEVSRRNGQVFGRQLQLCSASAPDDVFAVLSDRGGRLMWSVEKREFDFVHGRFLRGSRATSAGPEIAGRSRRLVTVTAAGTAASPIELARNCSPHGPEPIR